MLTFPLRLPGVAWTAVTGQPHAVAPGGARIAALVWSALAFGALSLLTMWSAAAAYAGLSA